MLILLNNILYRPYLLYHHVLLQRQQHDGTDVDQLLGLYHLNDQ
jgi:hypothetical protein